ncbi:MAG: hypothetical protein KKI14_02385 [Nanoarchaeota archaeon]|nr:hypothetical protein [Nanoarchaeota archaeon]
MITADIETGSIRITAFGEDAFIVRKSRKIKITSEEKLKDGDTIACGSKTVISIDVSYNKGKDKPIDDYKSRESKTVYMGPNSELQVSGFEEWDKTDKEGQRHHGELIRNIELKKGFFHVSYSHCENVLKTSVASIKFIFSGGGFFDVCNDSVYSSTIPSTSVGAGGIEYTNKLTRRTFIAKSSIGEEIIVTRDGIYKKPITKMDDIFQNSIQLLGYFTGKMHQALPTMDPKKMAEQYKNMPKQMEEGLGGIEMMKNMSPKDIERMMKMAESHGAKLSAEQMKMMKELPEKLKALEKSGKMTQMKKGMAMSKGMLEGLGDKGTDRFAKMQTEGMEKMKKMSGLPVKITTSDGKTTDIETLLESPRRYKPLTDAKKVA